MTIMWAVAHRGKKHEKAEAQRLGRELEDVRRDDARPRRRRSSRGSRRGD